MPDTTTSKDTTVTLTDDERKAKRRTKLRALAGKRPSGAGGVAAPKVANAVPASKDDDGADVMARRRAIARIYRVLSDTPADDTGMVEGTPFTQSGVARLLDTLKSRADSEGQSGAKVAAGILKFLSAKDGEANVHGASLERLQRVAKTADGRIKGRRQSAN